MEILNLGAGNKIMPEAVNHDLLKHRPEIAVAHDLEERPWPWPDNAFALIIAASVFEHLRLTLVEAMDECWRLLRPGGRIRVKLPHWQHDNSYADPTHRWRYSLRSLDYFDPATKLGSEYGFYTARKWKIVEPAGLNKQSTSLIALLEVRK